jgi:predicted transcriptional regulator of viral defense system
MPYRDARKAYDRLLAVAQRQGGYVTTKQARAAGFDYNHLSYHVAAGNLTRESRGLYRLPEVSRSTHDQLVRLSLWSRDRRDRPQAVVSHDTALALHELSDALPARVHLSVPRTFRKRPPKGCVLHRHAVSDEDAETWEGFRVTTPLRTLRDVADDPRFSREQLGRAIEDAAARGLVRRTQLATLRRALRVPATRTRHVEALAGRR